MYDGRCEFDKCDSFNKSHDWCVGRGRSPNRQWKLGNKWEMQVILCKVNRRRWKKWYTCFIIILFATLGQKDIYIYWYQEKCIYILANYYETLFLSIYN